MDLDLDSEFACRAVKHRLKIIFNWKKKNQLTPFSTNSTQK